MSSRAVLCTVSTRKQADHIVARLGSAGCPGKDVHALPSDRKASYDLTHEKHTKAPTAAAKGGLTGGMLGGALGWMVGIGALAIPVAGPFIAAGPLMATLFGAAVGGAMGGITGAMIGLSLPQYEAKRVEALMRDGKILLSVGVHDDGDRERIMRILAELGATDIAATSVTTHPDPGPTRRPDHARSAEVGAGPGSGAHPPRVPASGVFAAASATSGRIVPMRTR